MQAKKPAFDKLALIKTQNKPKLVSPQKPVTSKFSPLRPNGKPLLAHSHSKDFFTYTPLRQKRISMCSTPELLTHNPTQSDVRFNEIVSQKRHILDHGKTLTEKLKVFQDRVKNNYSGAYSYRANAYQVLSLVKALQKRYVRIMKKNVGEVFLRILEVYNGECMRLSEGFWKKVKEKCFRRLKFGCEKVKIAKNHYGLQLMVKSFVQWTELIGSCKSSSIQTNDSIAEIANPSKDSTVIIENCSFASDESTIFQLDLLSERFHTNSLLYFNGLLPWKRLANLNRHKKENEKLAADNSSFKLLLRAFNGLYSNLSASKTKPQSFRKIFLLQKSFKFLKSFDKVIDKNHELVTKYRKCSLLAKMIDNWKLYVQIQHILKEKASRRLRIISSIAELRNKIEDV